MAKQGLCSSPQPEVGGRGVMATGVHQRQEWVWEAERIWLTRSELKFSEVSHAGCAHSASSLPPLTVAVVLSSDSSQEPFILLGFNEDLRELLIMCVLHLSIVTVFELKLEELLSVRIHSITCSTSCQSDLTSHHTAFEKHCCPLERA